MHSHFDGFLHLYGFMKVGGGEYNDYEIKVLLFDT